MTQLHLCRWHRPLHLIDRSNTSNASNDSNDSNDSSSASASAAGDPPGEPAGTVEDNTPTATNPQAAVLQDPDANLSDPKKLAQVAPNSTSGQSTDSAPKRRGYPAPLDPVFPSAEWLGCAGTMDIGIPDTDPEYPLEKQIYKILPALKKNRIKMYGWIAPGGGYSSSRNSNIPLSYAIVPKRIELDQAIFRVERVPDTVQQEHWDWGFRSTVLYGIDYRWTASQGWYPATNELFNHNYLYGFDPMEQYGMIYIPKVCGHKIFQGMVMKFGRFISPPDIEAQLAPDNFLWTHSQMFTVDASTLTGLINTIKLNDNWTVQAGITGGNDMFCFDKLAIPTALLLAKWISKTNNDSIYGGANTVNNGRFRGARAVIQDENMITAINTQIRQGVANGAQGFVTVDGQPYQYPNLNVAAHDNLQQYNLTWQHKFNDRAS